MHVNQTIATYCKLEGDVELENQNDRVSNARYHGLPSQATSGQYMYSAISVSQYIRVTAIILYR